jgi:hypothetical protein
MSDCRANYPIFQAHLFHENDNLNQRLFWYVFSQSLLFGAYGAALNVAGKPLPAQYAELQETLVWLLPATSLLMALALYPMILISVNHMSGLRKQFEAQIVGAELADLPPIHGNPTLRKIADLAYLTIPLILTGAWLVLISRIVF